MKPKEIKEIMAMAGIAPTKYRGQNFLCNDQVIKSIVSAAALQTGDRVLEIGPGLGVLTRALIATGAKILAVEKDRNFVALLNADASLQFHTLGMAELLEGDILQQSNIDLVNRLGGEPYKVVANIPYNITGAIIEKFLEEEPRPQALILMVQAEVADRLISRSPMTLAGILTSYLATVERVTRVSRQSFWPVPKVDSAVVKITPHAREVLDTQPPPRDIFPLIKAGFANRRKQLANTLAEFYGSRSEAMAALQAAGIQPEARAETLSIADWIRLARVIQ